MLALDAFPYVLARAALLIPYHCSDTERFFLASGIFIACSWRPQAMGTTALNMHERMDGLLYALVHPQKPMVTTRVLDLVHFDQASLVEHASWHIL